MEASNHFSFANGDRDSVMFLSHKWQGDRPPTTVQHEWQLRQCTHNPRFTTASNNYRKSLHCFQEEVIGNGNSEWFPEFGVVQDANRLDATGIARCFTFGGSRKRMLHDLVILPQFDLSKEQYMNKEEQNTINHFLKKLLKLKDMMKTTDGQRRAERRHKFMEEFVKEFYDEWNGLI